MGDFSKNVAVISLADLERIRRTVGGTSVKEEENMRAQMDRDHLKHKSNKRMANWGNTAEALRQKKEDDRMKKFEEEELERRRIDDEEEEIAGQKRRSAIEKANKQLHDGSDQVKAFHSAMFAADVMQEREMQLELNGRKKQFANEMENKWADLEKQQMADYDEREAQKINAFIAQKQETTKFVNAQLQDAKSKLINSLKEEYLEGELMKRKAKADLEAERQEQADRRARAMVAQEETKQINQHLQHLRQAEVEKEKDFEQQTIQYAEKRDAMTKMRKEREEQRFADKLATRQQMIDRQCEELARIQNRENEILEKQVEEAEVKARERFELQQARKAEMQNQIHVSRQLQMERKRQEREEEIRREKDFAGFWKQKMSDLQQMEDDESNAQRNRNMKLQNYHKKQMDYKARKAEQEALVEAEMASQGAQVMDDEAGQFNSYAEQCLQEWADQGKNVTPLILQLKNYKKKAI